MTVVYHPEFPKDVRKFAAEYLEISPGLAERFLKEVDDALEAVKAAPQAAGLVLRSGGRPFAGDDIRQMGHPQEVAAQFDLLRPRPQTVKGLHAVDGRNEIRLEPSVIVHHAEQGRRRIIRAQNDCFQPAGEDHRTLQVWDLRLIRTQLRALKLDWD